MTPNQSEQSMAASLLQNLSPIHRYVLWILPAVTCGLCALNWLLVLNGMHVRIDVDDPNIPTINQAQGQKLWDEVKTYYDYHARAQSYGLVIIYIVLPPLQMTLRYIALFIKLTDSKRFKILFGSTMSTMASLLIPYASLVQSITFNGEMTTEHGSLKFGYENKHGIFVMFLNSYLSYSFGLYLLYLHFYKCADTKHNGLINEAKYKHLSEIETEAYDSYLFGYMFQRQKVYVIFPILLFATLFLFIYCQFMAVVKVEFVGYLFHYFENTLGFELKPIELSAYDIYDQYSQSAYFENSNFFTSKAVVTGLGIVYLMGNLVLPIWLFVLLTVLWFVPFQKAHHFKVVWHMTIMNFVLITPGSFVSVLASLVIFQKRVSTDLFYTEIKTICDEIGGMNENGGVPVCFGRGTSFTDEFILYMASVVLIVTVMAISFKAVSTKYA